MGILDFLKRRKEIRYILSIDGGGMRGIIPSVILSKLSAMLSEYGDERPLYSHFDLIAGTSTGALIALALTMPNGKTGLECEDKAPLWTRGGYIMPGSDPDAFVSLYRDRGPEIFPKTQNFKSLLYPILTDKYEAKPYERFLSSAFMDSELSDALVPTAAIAYSTTDDSIYTMRSWDSHGLLSREAARASSAAPMYFPPAEIRERDTGISRTLIDGGVAANNPALIAYSEARKLYPDAAEYRILSLSTCAPPYRFNPSEGVGGLTGWASPILKVYGNASLNTVDEVMPSIKGVRYTRIWAPVLEHRIKLDATTSTSIATLLDAAEKTYKAKEEELRAFAYDISKEKTHSSVRFFQNIDSNLLEPR